MRTDYDLRVLLFNIIPFLLMTRAGIKNRLKRLKRLEYFVPALKKISFNEGRNNFIPIFI